MIKLNPIIPTLIVKLHSIAGSCLRGNLFRTIKSHSGESCFDFPEHILRKLFNWDFCITWLVCC